MCTLQCGSNPATVSILLSRGHWLYSWECRLNSNIIAWWHWGCPSLGKVLITLHCLSFTGFWCLRSWMWCYGLQSLLQTQEKYHGDLWHFPFSSYSLSQQWCGNLWWSDGMTSTIKASTASWGTQPYLLWAQVGLSALPQPLLLSPVLQPLS